MNEQQTSEFCEKLLAGKLKRPAGAFPRGWNAALDWAVKQLQIVEGDENDKKPPDAEC